MRAGVRLISNSDGVTLVELVVAIGLTAISAGVAATIVDFQGRNNRLLAVNLVRDELVLFLRSYTSNKVALLNTANHKCPWSAAFLYHSNAMA